MLPYKSDNAVLREKKIKTIGQIKRMSWANEISRYIATSSTRMTWPKHKKSLSS